jgi:hypothetical protein
MSDAIEDDPMFAPLPVEPQEKPLVILKTGDAPRIVRRIKRLLIDASAKDDCPASDKIFRRAGNDIVHLSRNRLSAEDQARGRMDGGPARDDDYHVADDLLIRAVTPGWFGDRVEREIDFRKPDKNGTLVAADPSVKLLTRVSEIISTPDFQPIKGTVETPTLRADYSLLTEPGYDRKSGLYYDPGRAVFPAIPDAPTKADAARMLELFTGERGILKDFPFTDGPAEPKGLSLAVCLAMLLTSVCRRALRTAPMFAIDAYEAQSGKTLLGHIAGALATGREIAVRPWRTEEYQRLNDLAMALEAGDAVLLYDNLGPLAPLTGDCFNLAITSPLMETRRLGSNSGIDKLVVQTNALLVGTGNHLVIGGDMAEGRVLLIRIIPDKPLPARSFLYRNLLEHVLANRPQLVAALLTILRGYAVASDKREPTKFRHHEWGDLVAGAVQWLGLPDPTLAENRAKVSDPLREVQEDVIRAWAKAYGDAWLEVGKLINSPTISALLTGWLDVRKGGLDFKTATPFFRELIGVPRLGFKVEHMAGDGNHRPARWRLASERPGDKSRFDEFRGLAEAQSDFDDEPIEEFEQ